MTQEDGALDSLVRKRAGALRVAQSRSLEETGHPRQPQPVLTEAHRERTHRLALDPLAALARALDTALDRLVENAADDVISPVTDGAHGLVRRPVSGDPGMNGMRQRTAGPPPDNPARMGAHPGRE